VEVVPVSPHIFFWSPAVIFTSEPGWMRRLITVLI
jgi:hypothetical protein